MQPETKHQPILSLPVVIVVFIAVYSLVAFLIGSILSWQLLPMFNAANKDAANTIEQDSKRIEDMQQFDAYIHEANVKTEQENYADALAIIEKAKAIAPDTKAKALTYEWSSALHYHLKNYDKAIADGEMALTLDPQRIDAYGVISDIALQQQDFTETLTITEKVLAIKQDTAWAHNQRGIALVELGRKSEGIQAFTKAIELEPNNTVFKDNLQWARSQ